MRERALSAEEFRAVWDEKLTLRTVYRDYYDRLRRWTQPGPTVEIGSGSGNLKDEIAGMIATDIAPSSRVDAVVDAQRMPFADASLANVVGVDVVHHIEYPRLLLAELQRVLRPGGRAVFVEPAVTPLSWLVFKASHPEPIDLRADPLADGEPSRDKHPFDANQALPTLLVGRHRQRWQRLFPSLQLVHREWLSVIAYPFSGGFRPWCLLPGRFAGPVVRAENRLPPAVLRVTGFRLLLVLERQGVGPLRRVPSGAVEATP